MKKQIKAIIDSREKNEDLLVQVVQHPDIAEMERSQLPAGDIEVRGVGFERKSIKDYAASLQDGRIDSQTRKLRDRYKHAYILVEGDMVDTDDFLRTNLRGESIRGSFASITARDSGVNAVIPCSNPKYLVDMAVRLARKHIEETNRDYLETSPVSDSSPVAMRMYGCMDGVGPNTAKLLYEQWPSMQEFVEHADYEKLQRLDGIGSKKAMQILEGVVTIS